MKRNLMRFSLLLFALLLSCNAFACKKKCKSTTFTYPHKIHMYDYIDDYVKTVLTDTVAKLMFNSDSVFLYELSTSPVQNKSKSFGENKMPTFYEYNIIKNHGILTAYEVEPLMLLLSSEGTFIPLDSMKTTTPFVPAVALSFKKNNSIVDVVFSISGGMMKIYLNNEKEIPLLKVIEERLVIKYFRLLLNDERLQALLNITKKY